MANNATVIMAVIIGLQLTFALIFASVIARLFWIHPRLRVRYPKERTANEFTHLLVVLGSGGHTSEITQMLECLDFWKIDLRTYVMTEGDFISKMRVMSMETTWAHTPKGANRKGAYRMITVPRARKIHQSLWTTPWTSIRTLLACIKLLGSPLNHVPIFGTIDTSASSPYPNIVLSNGPATGAIMILAAFLVRFAGMETANDKLITMHIESWARVNTLSLSSKLLDLSGICDKLLVQWPRELYKDGNMFEFLSGLEYRGRFVA